MDKGPIALILAATKAKLPSKAPDSESSDKEELAQELLDAVKSGKAAKVADALEAFVHCCGMGESEED